MDKIPFKRQCILAGFITINTTDIVSHTQNTIVLLTLLSHLQHSSNFFFLVKKI